MRTKLFLASVITATSLAAFAAAPRAESPPAGQKIVSVGGDVTEILYALGLADEIVAVDVTSTYPPEALKTKKSVGYMRALSTEGVLSSGGTAIVASDRAGPPEVVAALKSAAVTYHEVTEDNSAAGVGAKIRQIGGIVGHSGAADTLANDVAKKFEGLAALRAKLPGSPKRVLFIIAAQNGRATVGGKNTSADAIIALAGAKNAAEAVDGFKPVTDEQLVKLAPDAVIVMKRGSGPSTLADIRKLQGLQSSPAFAKNQLIEVDGSFVLGFGPRAPDAARSVMSLLYPEARDVIGQGQTQ